MIIYSIKTLKPTVYILNIGIIFLYKNVQFQWWGCHKFHYSSLMENKTISLVICFNHNPLSWSNIFDVTKRYTSILCQRQCHVYIYIWNDEYNTSCCVWYPCICVVPLEICIFILLCFTYRNSLVNRLVTEISYIKIIAKRCSL